MPSREPVFALEPVVQALSDSLLMAGSEAYQSALLFYNNLKGAKKANIGAAAVVYDDLSVRFPGAGVGAVDRYGFDLETLPGPLGRDFGDRLTSVLGYSPSRPFPSPFQA